MSSRLLDSWSITQSGRRSRRISPARTAAAEAFESWLAVLRERFTAAGMTAERARDVAEEVLCLIEGAVLLSRTTRSSAPMRTAGRAAARAVAAGLGD